MESTFKTNEPKLIDRVQILIDTVDGVLHSAQNLKRKAVNLKDVSTDATVAQSFFTVDMTF